MDISKINKEIIESILNEFLDGCSNCSYKLYGGYAKNIKYTSDIDVSILIDCTGKDKEYFPNEVYKLVEKIISNKKVYLDKFKSCRNKDFYFGYLNNDGEPVDFNSDKIKNNIIKGIEDGIIDKEKGEIGLDLLKLKITPENFIKLNNLFKNQFRINWNRKDLEKREKNGITFNKCIIDSYNKIGQKNILTMLNIYYKCDNNTYIPFDLIFHKVNNNESNTIRIDLNNISTNFYEEYYSNKYKFLKRIKTAITVFCKNKGKIGTNKFKIKSRLAFLHLIQVLISVLLEYRVGKLYFVINQLKILKDLKDLLPKKDVKQLIKNIKTYLEKECLECIIDAKKLDCSKCDNIDIIKKIITESTVTNFNINEAIDELTKFLNDFYGPYCDFIINKLRNYPIFILPKFKVLEYDIHGFRFIN